MYSEKTPDDGQRNCPKHVEFYSKNTFEKLVHLVGFIIRRSKVGGLIRSMAMVPTFQKNVVSSSSREGVESVLQGDTPLRQPQ